MPDGEIELQVNADGVEDAAGELDETATEPGGGAGGGGRRGGGVGGAGGRMVRLLGAIAGLLALIEPVLDVLGVVSNVLKAFVAPLAVVLLRVLQPVLRLMLELLPVWLNWIGNNEGLLNQLGVALIPLTIFLPLLADLVERVVNFVRSIPTKLDRLRDGLQDWLQSLISDVQNLPSRIGAFINSLPQKIGSAVADVLPSGPDLGGGGEGFFGGAFNDTGRSADDGDDGVLGSIIQIGGGLTPFIDEVTRNGNVDL